MLWNIRQQLTLTKQWRQQTLAWIFFLAFGLLSTLLSPFPSRSFWGHGITADGWLYWLLISGFVLTNSLVLQRYPQLFRWQLRGILVGSTLVALSIYPQLVNWKIDYTLHSGQLWPGTAHVLATAVYKNHQPIGLYSHRGFVGFSLAIASVLSLLALRNKWLPAPVALTLTVLYAITLSLIKVRGAMLAMLAGWLWFFLTVPQNKKTQRLLVGLALVGCLSFSRATIERRVVNAEIYASKPSEIVLKHFTSDRVYLWNKAWKGFLEKPFLGWGFSGYSTVDAQKLCPKDAVVVALEDYKVHCQAITDEIIEVQTGSTKAHNLFLDTFVSLGISGASSYFVLFGLYVRRMIREDIALVALVCVYLVYTLTWYDCGQFSHLGWWALSIQVKGVGEARFIKEGCNAFE